MGDQSEFNDFRSMDRSHANTAVKKNQKIKVSNQFDKFVQDKYVKYQAGR